MSGLIGQHAAERLLARAAAAGRLAHAYLFLGPAHAGKATAARLLAQAVNCAAGAAAVEGGRLRPCGTCESCRRVLAGTHPEVLEVRSASRTGQDISVEQARELRAQAALRPQLGRRRFFLLPRAEMLNLDSANALLKTLEEPPEYLTLVLGAPSPSQVLPTIRSRCQVVRFGTVAAAELTAALEARGHPAAQSAALARAAGGRPGLALRWASSPAVLEERRQVVALWVEALETAAAAASRPALGVRGLRLAESLRLLAETGREREGEPGAPRPPARAARRPGRSGPAPAAESAAIPPPRPLKLVLREHLELALELLRDVALLRAGVADPLLHHPDLAASLRALAATLDPDATLTRVRAVREAQQLLDRNVTPQLVLERLFWALICGPVPRPVPLFAREEFP